MTTLFYIIGILLGALVTSTVFYILKLRNEVQRQKKVIKEQHKLVEVLTFAAFGDKIKEHLDKKDCDCDKESTCEVEPTCEDRGPGCCDEDDAEILFNRAKAVDTAE